MGDKSPKSTHKRDSQKQTKADKTARDKAADVEAKRAVPPKQ